MSWIKKWTVEDSSRVRKLCKDCNTKRYEIIKIRSRSTLLYNSRVEEVCLEIIFLNLFAFDQSIMYWNKYFTLLFVCLFIYFFFIAYLAYCYFSLVDKHDNKFLIMLYKQSRDAAGLDKKVFFDGNALVANDLLLPRSFWKILI